MKKIKIFLASSITELNVDRQAIGNFFSQLNNIYIKRDIYFELVQCETYDNSIVAGGKQGQYDQEIKDSELCFILFFKKVGDYTKHEFEVALDAYKNCSKPKIVVYFKYVENGDDATDEVKAFMQMLDKELQHYYNTYQSMDTLKLGMLMQIKIMGLDAEEPVVENGKVMFGGKVIADAQNIPIFTGNNGLADLKSRLAKITPKYFDLQAEFVKGPRNDEITREYNAIAKEKAELEKQIKELEKAILEFTKTMLEKTSKGDLSPRQVAAYHALEKGDYDAALTALDLSAIMADLAHNEQMADGYIDRVQINVNELLSRVEVLKTTGITQHSAEEIEKLYQTAYDRIEKYNLDKEPLFAYACFLYDQKNYSKALEIAKQLQYHYSDPRAKIPENKIANLYSMMGALYLGMNQFDIAEEAYKKALDIYIKLAKENPDAFEPRLAMSYNNFGVLYKNLNRFDLAEEAYKKALDIYIKSAQKNPDIYEPLLADSYDNLGILYDVTNRFDLAEEAYKKALDIRIKLAQKNPDAFEPSLADSYNNLGLLYANTNRFDLAEEFHKKALDIRIKLAQKNPDAFEPRLADSYYNLGLLYQKTKRFDLAEDAYKKALDIDIKLAQKNPDAFEPRLAMSYNNLGILYANTNRFDLAEEVNKKALDIRIKLAQKNPDAFEPDLAISYNNLGALYVDTKRFDLAEEFHKKALDIRIKLAQQNPDIYEPYMTLSYNNLRKLYKNTKHFDIAEDAHKKALDIRIKLAEKNPDAFEPRLADSYNTLGNLYYNTNHFDLAEEAYKKALDIYIKLAQKNPNAFEPYLEKSYNNLATLYYKTGRKILAYKASKQTAALTQAHALAKKHPESPFYSQLYEQIICQSTSDFSKRKKKQKRSE